VLWPTLLHGSAAVSEVVVEIYRVFPKDSDAARTPNVPTRRFGKAFGHDDGPYHSIVRIAAPPEHFTRVHASRLTLCTKLRCFFKPFRVLVVQEEPMVRIRLPPAGSLVRT
jgi:hypothetical protein